MATCETEREEDIGVSFSNFFDLGSDSDLSLHSAPLQIAQNAHWEARKKANIKISRKVEGENSNFTIFNNNEEENEDIFLMQAYTSNSTRLFYLQAKLQ